MTLVLDVVLDMGGGLRGTGLVVLWEQKAGRRTGW